MKIIRLIPPWLWVMLIILYIVLPFDLLPDVLGLPGRIDDLLATIIGMVFLYMRSRTRTGSQGPTDGDARDSQGWDKNGQASSGRAESEGTPATDEDHYRVLGVTRAMPLSEIRRVYKEKLLQYHPDRVHSLGKEFQDLAEQKTKELNEAYQRILKEHEGDS